MSVVDRELVTEIANEVQSRGRNHCSGEPLIFDRCNLERAIEAAIARSGGMQTPSGLLDPVDGWSIDYLLSFAAKRVQDELENGDYCARRLRMFRDRIESSRGTQS